MLRAYDFVVFCRSLSGPERGDQSGCSTSDGSAGSRHDVKRKWREWKDEKGWQAAGFTNRVVSTDYQETPMITTWEQLLLVVDNIRRNVELGVPCPLVPPPDHF